MNGEFPGKMWHAVILKRNPVWIEHLFGWVLHILYLLYWLGISPAAGDRILSFSNSDLFLLHVKRNLGARTGLTGLHVYRVLKLPPLFCSICIFMIKDGCCSSTHHIHISKIRWKWGWYPSSLLRRFSGSSANIFFYFSMNKT